MLRHHVTLGSNRLTTYLTLPAVRPNPHATTPAPRCLFRHSFQATASSSCAAFRGRHVGPVGAAAAEAESKEAPSFTAVNGASKKVSIIALGCPKNMVDGEVLLGDLSRSGFEVTQEHEDADAIIINTCGFIEDAKSESLEAIMEAADLNEDGRGRKIVVTGCLAQRYHEELAEQLPEADVVMGFQNYAQLPFMLQSALGLSPEHAQTHSRVQVGEATVPFRPEWNRYRLTPQHTAYLRVAEGCNHTCTFCAIPSFRGKFRSKPWQALLDEAKVLVESGAKEINLIAEDTNQYGQDRRDGRGLAQLLREVSKLEGLHWLRILYAYPSYFTEELIDEIANNPKVCKYIDMPLQHISNLVLLAMQRPPREPTEKLLRKLRNRIPDLALRTTFISGFPSETPEQHRELVQFCQDFKFERMGVFAFSEEEGTPAAEVLDQVPQAVRMRRRDELVSLQQGIGEQFAQTLVGREVDVLVDGYDEDHQSFVGRTQWDAPDVDPMVFLTKDTSGYLPSLAVGQMRRCVIQGTSLFDLEASPLA